MAGGRSDDTAQNPEIQALIERAGGDAARLRAMGTALLELKQPVEAEALLRQATLGAPRDKLAWNLLGQALHRAGRMEEAAAAQRAALGIDEAYRDAWRWLGFSLEMAGASDDAVQAYDRALALQFHPLTAVRAAMLLPRVARSAGHIETSLSRMGRRLEALAGGGLRIEHPEAIDFPPIAAIAYLAEDERPWHEAVARFWLAVSPGLAWQASKLADAPVPGERLRIAVVTRFFYRHAISMVFGALIRALPEYGFDVRGFRPGDHADATTAEFERAIGPLVSLPAELDAARRAVAAFRPHVVLYPELGIDPATYFMAFARLAPLQVATWGHGGTSGVPAVDCFVSDKDLDPPGNEAHYTERLVRLPRSPVVFAAPDRPAELDHATLGVSPEAHLYVCLQSPAKLHPDFDAPLAKILASDPLAVIVLKGEETPYAERAWRQRFARSYGELDSRVRFTGRLDDIAYCGLIAGADVLLDTPHYAGGTTTLECLALGRPVVAWSGRRMRQRLAQALLGRLGLKALVAENADEYAAIAVRLAGVPAWRSDVERRVAAGAPALLQDQTGIGAFAAWLGRAAGMRR